MPITNRQHIFELSDALAQAGFNVTTTSWRTIGNRDLIHRPKSEWDGPLAYSIQIDVAVMKLRELLPVIAIAEKYDLDVWLSSCEVKLELRSKDHPNSGRTGNINTQGDPE